MIYSEETYKIPGFQTMLTAKDFFKIQTMINDTFDEKFDEKFAEVRSLLRSDMAEFKDEILSVVRPLQEDHVVLSHRVRELYDEVEGYSKRLHRLEKNERITMKENDVKRHV